MERALEHVFDAVLVDDWRAGHPGVRIRPARPVPGQVVRDVDAPWVTTLDELRTTSGAEQETEPLDCLRRQLRVRRPARGRAERPGHLQHERAQSLLERRAADRAPDLERREPPHGRPARNRNDLRPGRTRARQPDRADVERRARSSRTATRSCSGESRSARSAGGSSKASRSTPDGFRASPSPSSSCRRAGR